MSQPSAKVIDLTEVRQRCSACSMRELCLPVGLSGDEIERLDELVSVRRRVARGTSLYRSDAPFAALYAIRVGFFKTHVLHDDGRDQVTGFFMNGEIVGMDGIGTGQHACTATALEDSDVCVIPYARLEEFSRHLPALQHHFYRVMSREIVRDHGVMMLLGTMRAEERLAAFLLNLSQRLVVRGYSASEFHLRMTREEIGSYLGLKLETVSRLFSRFQGEGLIAVQQKHIRILDAPGLRAVMGQSTC